MITPGLSLRFHLLNVEIASDGKGINNRVDLFALSVAIVAVDVDFFRPCIFPALALLPHKRRWKSEPSFLVVPGYRLIR
jgi:hypothetical protein